MPMSVSFYRAQQSQYDCKSVFPRNLSSWAYLSLDLSIVYQEKRYIEDASAAKHPFRKIECVHPSLVEILTRYIGQHIGIVTSCIHSKLHLQSCLLHDHSGIRPVVAISTCRCNPVQGSCVSVDW